MAPARNLVSNAIMAKEFVTIAMAQVRKIVMNAMVKEWINTGIFAVLVMVKVNLTVVFAEDKGKKIADFVMALVFKTAVIVEVLEKFDYKRTNVQ